MPYLAGEEYVKGKCSGYGILFNNLKPTLISSSKHKNMHQKLNEVTKDVGRYHISWDWKNADGHSAILERLYTGELVMYDGQIDKHFDTKTLIKYIDNIEVYRVDNATINVNAIKEIVKPYQYKKKSKR